MTFKITFSHRERYLGTLLQVEGMLKTWFPHIAAQKSSLEGSRHQINKVRISKLRNNQEMDCVWRNVFLFPFSLSFLLVVVVLGVFVFFRERNAQLCAFLYFLYLA